MSVKEQIDERIGRLAADRDSLQSQLTARAATRKAMTDAHLAAVAAKQKEIDDLKSVHNQTATLFDAVTADMTARLNEKRSDVSLLSSAVTAADAAGVFDAKPVDVAPVDVIPVNEVVVK